MDGPLNIIRRQRIVRNAQAEVFVASAEAISRRRFPRETDFLIPGCRCRVDLLDRAYLIQTTGIVVYKFGGLRINSSPHLADFLKRLLLLILLVGIENRDFQMFELRKCL